MEIYFCDFGIRTVLRASRALSCRTVGEAIQPVEYGKSDTLGLDAYPELAIKTQVDEFDERVILVTEEETRINLDRWIMDTDPTHRPPVFFSDPVDGSYQLKQFLDNPEVDKSDSLGDILGADATIEQWEQQFGKPAIVTGSSSSISCLNRGRIIFTVIINHITGTMIVACSKGIYYHQLPKFDPKAEYQITLDQIVSGNPGLKFPPSKRVCQTTNDYQRFVTFLGKLLYQDNFNDCMIFVEEPEKHRYDTTSVGPPRPLFLSEFQNGILPIGFIMANGERVAEWIHWLSFVKFAKDEAGMRMLRIFEISIERPWTKEGVLMSTSPRYSAFKLSDDPSKSFFDLEAIRYGDKFSEYRSMLVITPYDNDWVIQTMIVHNYRPVDNAF